MAEKEKGNLVAKLRIGALVAAGAIVLGFLVQNRQNCPIHAFPLTAWNEPMQMPGMVFIVFWILVGFVGGSGACFFWLRKKKADKAVQEPAQGGKQGTPPGDSSPEPAKETPEEKN